MYVVWSAFWNNSWMRDGEGRNGLDSSSSLIRSRTGFLVYPVGEREGDSGNLLGLQFGHWGADGATLIGELKSEASVTGRCFWISKPALAFSLSSPHPRATVENSGVELTVHSRPAAQRRRKVAWRSGGFRSETGPETGTPDSPLSGRPPYPITF